MPICDCGEERESCPTCKRGYIEVVKLGEVPKFKEITVASKRVPVCKCGHERAECADCGRGYLTVTMLGEVPEFKVVEAKETPANETPDAAKPGQTCPLKFQIFFIGVSKFRFVHVQYDEF